MVEKKEKTSEVDSKVEESEKSQIPKAKSNYRVFFFVILAIIVLGAIFYMTKQNSDEVAATVNGEVITVKELDRLYSSLPAEYKAFSTKESILGQMVEKELLYQEAVKQGLSADEEEADKVISGAKVSLGLSEEQFQEKLKEQNTSEEELKREYVKQLTIQDLINKSIMDKIEVDDKEITDYYNENKDSFKVGAQVTVRHILIGDKELAPTEQEELAKKLLSEVNPENFCEYVSKYSTDTASVSTCGEYIFGKEDPYVEEFKELAFAQSPGQMGTVNTQFGTHIIWTVKKSGPKTLLLKDTKDQIKQALSSEKAQAGYIELTTALKQNAVIDIKYNQTG